MPSPNHRPIPYFSEKELQKFWSRVDKRGPEECWPWIGGRTEQGYGYIYIRGNSHAVGDYGANYVATRISLFIATGSVPVDRGVLHTCDNPPCVNPKHLFLGTAMDNTIDMLSKNREARGERHRMAILTDEKVLQIFNRCVMGISHGLIANQFGISRSMVGMIANGKRWTHVKRSVIIIKPQTLPDDMIHQIRRLYAGGCCFLEIERRTGVPRACVTDIIRRKRYSHVPSNQEARLQTESFLSEKAIDDVEAPSVGY